MLGAVVAKGAPRRIPIGDVQACEPWTVSQDGNLFGATEYATGNIAVIDATTGVCRAITKWGSWLNKIGYVDEGAISRDGKWVAAWHYSGKNNGEIRVAGTDGSGDRTIYVRTQNEWGLPRDWSPDGKWILMLFERDNMQLALVPVAGGEVKVLHSYPQAGRYRPRAVFSPDGKYVAWDVQEQPGSADTNLRIVSVNGGEPVTIAANAGPDRLLGWPADGDIRYLRGRGENGALYKVGIRDGKQVGSPVLLRQGVSANRLIGADSSGSVYFGEQDARMDAMLADIDIATATLSEFRLVAPQYPSRTTSTTWHKNGNVYSFLRRNREDSRVSIIIVDATRGKEKEIAVPSIDLSNRDRMFWSSDGNHLFGAATAGFHRIDVRTGETKQILPDTSSVEVSPDASTVYAVGGPGRMQILATDLPSGQSRIVYQGKDQVRATALSPDGKRIAFVGSQWYEDRPSPLLVLDIDTGAVRKLEEGWYAHTPSHLAWSPDGKNLLALGSRGSRTNRSLAIVPVDGAPVKDNIAGNRFRGNNAMYGLAFHPNGKTISWTPVRNETTWWAVE